VTIHVNTLRSAHHHQSVHVARNWLYGVSILSGSIIKTTGASIVLPQKILNNILGF